MVQRDILKLHRKKIHIFLNYAKEIYVFLRIMTHPLQNKAVRTVICANCGHNDFSLLYF